MVRVFGVHSVVQFAFPLTSTLYHHFNIHRTFLCSLPQGNAIGERGARAVSLLENLTTLSIAGENNMDSSVIDHGLSVFCRTENAIGPAGAKAVSCLTNLTELNISSCVAKLDAK